MSEIVIKIVNLSKEYRLGQVGTGTISHDLNRWWHKIRGKEDPYLKIGEINDREHKGKSDYVYALKDINLEVKKGEILGIIGKNGAGKSTLLKILSKVTGPTKGSIKTKGRIASLLEVGTGFHPELTGRENIYMNGTIMGMTRKEIDSKIDDIIHFAGIERYIDTPTKRYSSGMTVRLGFAVAAHLEPEILVVDEVLAVGDAEFQKKAIGKMKDISEGGGRTVLFVSHNMTAVQNLCERGLLLEQGGISLIDDIRSVIGKYISNNEVFSPRTFIDQSPKGEIATLNFVEFYSLEKGSCNDFKIGEAWGITVDWEVRTKIKSIQVGISVIKGGVKLYDVQDTIENLTEGHYRTIFSENSLILNSGQYTINIAIFKGAGQRVHFVKEAAGFTINDSIVNNLNVNGGANAGLLFNKMGVNTHKLF